MMTASMPLVIHRPLTGRVVLEDHIHLIVLKSTECTERKTKFEPKVNWSIDRLEGAEVEHYCALLDSEVETEIRGQLRGEETRWTR